MTNLFRLLVLSLLVMSSLAGKHVYKLRRVVEETLEESVVSEEQKEQKDEVELTDELAIVERLSKKLTPKYLDFSNFTSTKSMLQHQFLHLHHMKTGGTSLDGLLSCGMGRWKQVHSEKKSKASIGYMNIHECGKQRYLACRDGKDTRCRDSIRNSSILSYCAPLVDLPTFGWNSTLYKQEELSEKALHAVTVLRSPVERVWSMFRFETKRCYHCKNLRDIYRDISKNKTTIVERCAAQLQNHQTHNLVSIKWNPEEPELMVQNAIENLQHFFTLVGLTEQMEQTATMVGQVFPFLNLTYGESPTECPMPHENRSPRNNRCGKDGKSHWNLPNHPDEATKRAILKHNAMDLQVYEAALQLFEYQKMALALGEDIK